MRITIRALVGFGALIMWLSWAFILLTLATSWAWALGLYVLLLLTLLVFGSIVWENQE